MYLFFSLFKSASLFYDFGYTGNRQALLSQNSVAWVNTSYNCLNSLRVLNLTSESNRIFFLFNPRVLLKMNSWILLHIALTLAKSLSMHLIWLSLIATKKS